ncbi:MAG: hypothetical protein D3919_12430 [Candidatus Electrothrix sp. AW5]|nr:hypothetical protein [Candidatus Electrothrix sp. AX1]MCI5183428.1 hypothetical protein [Candidatus Electrothrix gigas]MCI5197007.1 hypothetical protein [Candidatus Electrothrix gigas]
MEYYGMSLSWWFSDLVFNGCFSSILHDRLAGELVKARLMKSSKQFDKALEVIDNTLHRLPNHPEALLLKAQILWEGYDNYPAAKACLQKVIQKKKFKDEQDEIIYRWSMNLLNEMRQAKRTQHARARKDRGQG